jgi:hypothetical protein
MIWRLCILIGLGLGTQLAMAETVIKVVKPGLTAGEPSTVVEYHTGLRKGRTPLVGLKAVDFAADPDCQNLPDHFDLLTDVQPMPVSAVRNQGSCGSCWSFSESGGFESWLRTMGKGDFDLSEQELVSNDSANYGCGGGNLSSYQSVNGQGKEVDFPYRAADVPRKTIPAVAKAPSWEVVGGSGAAKELGMKCAIFKYRTVPWVTLGADDDWGSPPTTDGAVWTRCSNNGTNHAIGYTGWKTVNGKVYFHAKNSWGTSWGQGGYAWIPKDCDGFGDEVAFLPTPPAPTCDGKPVGTIKDVACPVGQVGEHKQECKATGWSDTINSCVAPTPTPTPTPFSLPIWAYAVVIGLLAAGLGFLIGRKS